MRPSVFMACIFLVSLPLHAAPIKLGDKIGNGGGLWSCMIGGQLTKAELVDLFEAREEFKLTIPGLAGQRPDEIFQNRIELIKERFPWLYSEVVSYARDVLEHRTFVNNPLNDVNDALPRLLPNPLDCQGGEWKYTQFANYTHYQKLLIPRQLWENENISSLQKGALLIHETIYAWLRRRYSEKDSVRTRQIVGLLFSDLSEDERVERIRALLGEFELPPPDEAPSEPSGFFVNVTSETAQLFTHRADADYGQDIGTGNFSAPCRIDGKAPGEIQDISCVVEAEELDLYFSELQVQVHVPANMCSYLVQKPYFYYRYEPGDGPTNLEVTFDADGKIISHSEGIDPSNGQPSCRYDYSYNEGPNCCVGNYHLTTTRRNPASPDIITYTDGSWGGSAATCLSGAAVSASNSNYIGQDGFPRNMVTYVQSAGYNGTFKILAAINHDLNANIFSGNFYTPSKHGGGLPKALQFPRNLSPANGIKPQDSYEWECVDRSSEPLARIRLFIREWNTGPIMEGGNPDAAGDGLNDRLDWLDFGDRYPGVAAY